MSGLDDDALCTAATDYLSPPVWDLGHMANFEERWLVQTLADRPELHPGDNDTYNAFEHPRPERPSLPLRDRAGCKAYMEQVRAETLRILDDVDVGPDTDRLTREAFVHWMLVLHEHQHQETLLQTIQMRAAAVPAARGGPSRSPAERGTGGVAPDPGYTIPGDVRRLPEPRAEAADLPRWCHVPAGRFEMGAPFGPGVYDNEAPPHGVDVAAFDIARFPITCGDYLAFIEDGGYDEPSVWSDRGRRWLAETDHHAPLYWRRDDDAAGGWVRRGPGCTVPVADWPDVILCHVTHFEAEAYAAWAAARSGTQGARLPTEAEWEKACRWDPATGENVGRNPWGDQPATTDAAAIDQLSFSPSRVGAFATGAAPCGAEHMIGDVWEWTSSGFEAYPGFEAFPYEEYSKAFFGGDHRVLRGGSWATRSGCATGTFRNWDHPYRRQIFSGIRLVRDA